MHVFQMHQHTSSAVCASSTRLTARLFAILQQISLTWLSTSASCGQQTFAGTCQNGFEASMFASARGVRIALKAQSHVTVIGTNFGGETVIFALERPLQKEIRNV